MDKIQIGSLIKSERKKQNLSQQTLADKANISRRQQIIEIENAQYDYGIDVLIKVADALGIEVGLTITVGEHSESFDFSKVDAAEDEETVYKKPVKKTKSKK